MHDEVHRYLRERWDALANANALFTRPRLDLSAEEALAYLGLERIGLPLDLKEKRVLCLAGGGGQQSAAFALLGAEVTVLDISPVQLERDQAAAEHYGVTVGTVQGDMRDLSVFTEEFDLVWHPYSLTFVPDARVVFREVSRVMRPGGHYHVMCANPFFSGLTHDSWNGEGYTLKDPYTNGAETTYPDQEWVGIPADGQIPRPREYRQTLSHIMNGLIREGFVLTYVNEVTDEGDPEVGSWGHFMQVAPPWLEFVWRATGETPDHH
ncbi:class I SAM-dependent methyltransferase [Nonomuraea turkmeniaca]|nr:class I SAM-dependent methyltransferase [Nonomuraea turkmeniaca]